MKSVKVRDIVIGEGRAKICVPIVGPCREDILREAEHIRKLEPDVVELRADCFDAALDFDALKEILKEVREILGNYPLLFTMRSPGEGGAKEISDDDYLDLNIRMIKSGIIDMVDAELLKGRALTDRIVEAARDAGVKVIISNHDFSNTPGRETIIGKLKSMQDAGADIIKIAVMPKNSNDVELLINAAEEMYNKYAEVPIIAISMGEPGIISRTDCESFGAAMTFASASKASAPGQIDITELRKEMYNDNR